MRIALVPSLLITITASLFGCATMPEGRPVSSGSTGAPSASASAAPVATVTAENAEQDQGLGKDEKKEAAEGGDAEEERGNLKGDELGDSFGAGGLGLSGTGKGGGGMGDGGIGLGSAGTIGHGAGTGTGQGYGSGAGRAGGGRSGGGKVAAATAMTTGSGLPPEVIQRIIRANVGRIQGCYEKAMAKNPALAGKVGLSFTIGAQGTVTSVTAGDATISDAEMVTCVISAVKAMTFPAPEGGGTVNVTYPFVFAPADS